MTSSAVLKRLGNENPNRVWTSGYWKVFLFDDAGVAAVKDYVEDHNLRRGLPARVVSWVAPID